jgi:hypothetical protein
MIDEKEVLKETILYLANKLWLYESNLICMEAGAKAKKSNYDLSEDPDYCILQGNYSATRRALVNLKSKLANSESSLYFNRLSIKD